jgi:rod shape determining protein RodA
MAQLDLVASSARLLSRERSPLRHVDMTLLGAVIGLGAYGLMMVYSATHRSLEEFGQDPGLFLKKQAGFLALGVVALILAAVIDYRWVRIYAPFLYLGTVLLLLLVRTPLGDTAKGAQRWFQIGGFQLSPSLFARVSLVVMLAAVLSSVKGELQLGQVLRVVLLAAVPMVLVFVQPDIGTTIILSAVLVALLVVAGTKAKYLVLLSFVAMVGIFGAFQLHIVRDYQIQRLQGFFDSSASSQSASYNKEQAEIAIGAGGVIGRGYLKGTQTNLDFVPEQHTDFIFTVVGEEFGFIGALFLLALFSVVLWRAFRIALLSKDPFGTFLAVGVASMFAIQVFVNVGMTVGIMPITGIPLPFISYGGSALIADMIGVGLLLNVHMRRFI